MVLSNRDDWVVHKGWLANQGTEGREAINGAIKELINAGYVSTYQEPREDGKFSSKVWHFYDTPRTVDGKPLTGSRNREAVDGNPSTKKDYQNNDQEKKATGKRSKPSILSKIQFPEVLDTIDFTEAWDDWLSLRKSKRLKPYTTDSQLKRLAGLGYERALAAVKYSTIQEYDGIHEPKNSQTQNGTYRSGDRNRNTGTYNEGRAQSYKGFKRTS